MRGVAAGREIKIRIRIKIGKGAEEGEDILGNASLPPLDDGGGNADFHCWRRKTSSRARRRTLRTLG